MQFFVVVAKTCPICHELCVIKSTYLNKYFDKQIPGVPIMYITQHKYSIERLPEATMGGGNSITQ